VALVLAGAMKVAILTRDAYRSPLYLALGLRQMLAQIRVAATVFPRAVDILHALQAPSASLRNRALATYGSLWLRRMASFDLIVVSETVGFLRNVELIQSLRRVGNPVFMYEVFAAAGSRYWLERLPDGATNLFDAYLAASGIHDDQPVDGPPIFQVGLRLLDAPTHDDTRPFVAMVDFLRPGYEQQRAVQIEALQELGVPYFSLGGEYTFDGIASQYHRAALAFVAFPEAFGVPIAQLQQLGSLIASPHKHWVKRHALLPNGTVFNEADAPFTDNFVFYNGKSDLKTRIAATRANYRPATVSLRFRSLQPALNTGDLDALRCAMDFARRWQGR
jgi:hypothetical protein